MRFSTKFTQNIKVLAACALLAVGMLACSDDDENTTPNNPPANISQQDRDFARMAGHSNANEVMLAQLALARAQHDSVMAFAQSMVADHTMAQQMLKQIGDSLNVSVPDTMDAAHQAIAAQLAALTGHAFDSAYMKGQVADHQVAQQLMQTQINQGQNAALKNYASTTLPHIQMHLQRAILIEGLVNP